MSEFAVNPEDMGFRPLGEALAETYNTVREKLGGFVSSMTVTSEYSDNIAYAEQQSGSSQQSNSGEQSPPAPAHGPGSSCAATACSACGTGTPQWTTRPGLRG